MAAPNVVFILVDALRASSLGCYGYPRATSPIIDKLARQGVAFEHAFCTVNATDPSLTTLFSGLYPRSHGILHHGDQISQPEIDFFLSQGVQLLPDILHEKGYTTFGLDWLGRWHRSGYDYYAGFSVDRAGRKKTIKQFSSFFEKIGVQGFFRRLYYLPVLRSLFGKFDLYSEDGKLTTQAVDIIKENSIKKENGEQANPFFIFIHYWGLHAPYTCPREYSSEFQKIPSPVSAEGMDKSFEHITNQKYRAFYEQWTKNERSFDDVIARHDGAIRHIDDQIGMVVRALEESGQLDNTLIVVTSDHGESLVEHGILFDHHGLYDASVHVPLIFYYPSSLRPCRVSALVQHVDVMPTLRIVLGLPSGCTDGYSLIPLINKRAGSVRDAVYIEENYYEQKICVRTPRYKLIRDNGQSGCSRCGIVHGDAVELYDLGDDPGENVNIATQQPRLAARLSAMLDAHLQRFSGQQKKETEMIDKLVGEIDL